jgi:Plasmid stabilization system protein
LGRQIKVVVMSLRVIFTSIARMDIVDATYYLAERNVNAAAKFFDCVRHSAQRLSEMPELGTVVQWEEKRMNNVRIWPVKNFSNYLIFYQIRMCH